MGRNKQTFKAGHPKVGGRQKGSPNQRPSIVRLFQLAAEGVDERKAVASLRKLIQKSHPRTLELIAAYLDGRPTQRVALETPQAITFVMRPPEPKE